MRERLKAEEVTDMGKLEGKIALVTGRVLVRITAAGVSL